MERLEISPQAYPELVLILVLFLPRETPPSLQLPSDPGPRGLERRITAEMCLVAVFENENNLVIAPTMCPKESADLTLILA